MLCGKNGKQDSATERRIHNSGDVLPSLHHYDALPYPIIQSGGKNALWANGKQDSATERRIYYPDDALTSLRHYDALPYPVIQSGGKNAL